MLDKKKIKEQLEKERDMLLEQMRDLGKLDPETGDWEATPEELSSPESDPNDMADRFEDYEAKSSMIKVLGPKLKSVLAALKNLSKVSFGKCKICKKDIEKSRMEASPTAQTCKKHLES